MKECSECGKEDSRLYRCAHCPLKYCSVGCFKEHGNHCEKEKECTTTSIPEPETSPKQRSCLQEIPAEDVLTDENMMKIRNDDRINELLKSSKLRNLIRELDNTPAGNTNAVLSRLMKDPEFLSFSNVVLDATGVNKMVHEDSD